MISKSLKSIQNLQQNGYLLLKNVVSAQICKMAIFQAERMKQLSGFNAKKKQDNCSFLQSNFIVQNNKVSYFFQNAYDNDPNLNKESLIKIGHTLHLNKVFKQITYSKAVKQLQSDLATNFIVLQSMVLEKIPIRGGTLGLHQDSTYLLNEPDSILAWWMPLQDVSKQNGCLWVLPGSHQGKLYSRFKIIDNKPTYQFDGPIDYNQNDCIPIQMQKGDLLVFQGRLLHKSNDNLSNNTRYAYSWHTMNKNTKWIKENWRSEEQILATQTIDI